MNDKLKVNGNSSLNIVEGCLILNLPREIDDDIFLSVKRDLLNRTAQEKLLGVILDFGSIKIMDSYEFNQFLDLIKMVKLLGHEAVAVGFQPGLVSALIDMNVDTTDLVTFLTMGDALEYMRNKFRKKTLENEAEEESIEGENSEDE